MKYILYLLLLIPMHVLALPADVLSTDTSIVCVHGYSATVRNVPVKLKKQVYKKYNTIYLDRTKCPSGYEVDHIIPLSIGGSNHISNLQLQSYCGARNATHKDIDEKRILKGVCSGSINILDAQQDMRDWK